MKHIIILGDGMADEPIEALGGLTPLQAADTPYMDKLAALGRNGRLKTVPDGFHPGSEVANMAVLGYNMPKVYEGRGVLEAASIGVELQPGDLIMTGTPEGVLRTARHKAGTKKRLSAPCAYIYSGDQARSLNLQRRAHDNADAPAWQWWGMLGRCQAELV